MSKPKKFFAVKKGTQIGVFDHWDQVQDAIVGIEKPIYKSFLSREAAELWLKDEQRVMDLRFFRNHQTKKVELRWFVPGTKGFQSFDTSKSYSKLANRIETLCKDFDITQLALDDLTVYNQCKRNQSLCHLKLLFNSNKVHYIGNYYNAKKKQSESSSQPSDQDLIDLLDNFEKQ